MTRSPVLVAVKEALELSRKRLAKILRDMADALERGSNIGNAGDLGVQPFTAQGDVEALHLNAWHVFCQNFNGTVNHRHVTATKAVIDYLIKNRGH